ncbi:MAG: hypothetical protein ACXVJ7_01310 [Acidimicrobiia bacterium]
MRKLSVSTVLVVVAAMVFAACGSSGAAKSSSTLHGGMTDAQMKCMDSTYAAKHHELCAHGAGRMNTAPVKTAKPLTYNADGTINPAHIDLSGVPGVSATQTKEAEDLLKSTLAVLPKWSNYQTALADGFQSIGDGITGEEHVIHWDWIDDNTVFDPNHPESLVYKVDRATGNRTLEAAMFIMPKQYTLDNVPPIASNLVQFHVHDNLCFTPPPAPLVRGITDAQGNCRPPLVKFNPNPMVHVWIRANDCGPFAALLGVGAGQTKSGQRNCDHDHGKLTL